MNFFQLLSEKWNMLCQKAQPFLDKSGEVFHKVWRKVRSIGIYVIKLRKIFLAVPVAAAAVLLALNNLRLLPAVVGINLMADGNFSMVLGRLPAVLAPLVDCVYAETTAEKIPQLEAAVKAVSPAADFCPIVTDKTGVAGTYLLKE